MLKHKQKWSHASLQPEMANFSKHIIERQISSLNIFVALKRAGWVVWLSV